MSTWMASVIKGATVDDLIRLGFTVGEASDQAGVLMLEERDGALVLYENPREPVFFDVTWLRPDDDPAHRLAKALAIEVCVMIVRTIIDDYEWTVIGPDGDTVEHLEYCAEDEFADEEDDENEEDDSVPQMSEADLQEMMHERTGVRMWGQYSLPQRPLRLPLGWE